MRLTGEVSLLNNGGFVQASLGLDKTGLLDAYGYTGIEIEVYGNNENYNLHLRSADTRIVWQSYRAGFQAPPRRGGHWPRNAGGYLYCPPVFVPLNCYSRRTAMMTFTLDPMTLNDVTNLDEAPFVIEGQGSGLVKIYFESEANKTEYLDLTPHAGVKSSGLKKIYEEMADNPDTGSIN